jgi:hypothetical protein
MIDPVTMWLEIAHIKRRQSEECMEVFNTTWMCRYPRPQYIGFNNESKFKKLFKELCLNFDSKGKLSTEYNPLLRIRRF